MPRRTRRHGGESPRPAPTARGLLLAGGLLADCSAPLASTQLSEQATGPELGACHRLSSPVVAEPSTTAAPVSCRGPHTAETFRIGRIPAATGEDYSSPRHGRWVFERCRSGFERFLSVDESLAMRVQLDWAWFRPSQQAWEDGARWYRCDVVGSGNATRYPDLPVTVRGLFRARPPEQWLTCAKGPRLSGAVEVPCSAEHDWRAVTTIKLGEPEASYPGDRLVQVRTRDYCSDSVGAWMNYPVDYEFGFTGFREAEWQAGNRRSVCWARTGQ